MGQCHVRPKECRLTAMTSGCHSWRVTRPLYIHVYGLHSTRMLCAVLPGTLKSLNINFLTSSKLCCLLKVTLHGVIARQRRPPLIPPFKYNKAKRQNNGTTSNQYHARSTEIFFVVIFTRCRNATAPFFDKLAFRLIMATSLIIGDN